MSTCFFLRFRQHGALIGGITELSMSKDQSSEIDLHERLREVAERLAAVERSVEESGKRTAWHLRCIQQLLEIQIDLREVQRKLSALPGAESVRDFLCRSLQEDLSKAILPYFGVLVP